MSVWNGPSCSVALMFGVCGPSVPLCPSRLKDGLLGVWLPLRQEESITHILHVTVIQDVMSRVNVSRDHGQGIGVLERIIVCRVSLWFAEALACPPCRSQLVGGQV